MSAFNYKTAVVPIGLLDSTGSPARFIFRAPEQCLLRQIYVVDGTTMAASNSNAALFTFKNIGAAGAGTTTVATQTNTIAGLVLTADVPKASTMSTTAADLELAEGDMIQLTLTETGTMNTTAEAVVIVVWSPGSGPGQ